MISMSHRAQTKHNFPANMRTASGIVLDSGFSIIPGLLFVNSFTQIILCSFVINHRIAVNKLGFDQQTLTEFAVVPDPFEEEVGSHGADGFLFHVHRCQAGIDTCLLYTSPSPRD